MADVYLYIYDLSMGMAKVLSQSLIGRHFDGIWHTGVVVHGREYFFSQEGINSCRPGSLQIGQPIEQKLMGQTNITKEGLHIYLDGLNASLFRPGSYDLLKHNCNSFSAHFVKHLTGNDIPAHITSLPSDFLSTPIGSALRGMLEGGASITGPEVSQFAKANRVQHKNIMPSTVKQVLFDEPLSLDYAPEELRAKFSGTQGIASQWTNSALNYLLQLSSPKLVSEDVPPEALSLLKFNRWATFQQCEAICEIFRLAVWRCPELLLSMLTDTNRSLHQLAGAFPSPKGQISPTVFFDLDAAKSRLLCNFFSLSNDWELSQIPFLPLGPIAALCNRLIAVEEEEQIAAKKPSPRSPEHEMAGLALTLNFALCPLVEESEAMEVAVALFHLVETRKGFKHPGQAHYVLQAVYAFIKRFPTLADLAKTLNLAERIPEIASQAEHTEGEPTTSSSHVEAVNSINRDVMTILAN